MKFVRPQRGGISTDDDVLSHHRVIGIGRLLRITQGSRIKTLAQIA